MGKILDEFSVLLPSWIQIRRTENWFLRSLIALNISRQYFNQWEAKPIAPQRWYFSRAFSKLQVIVRNTPFSLVDFVFPPQILWRYPGEYSKLDIFMLPRSLSNEHDMGSNLMGIRRHMICIGKTKSASEKGIFWLVHHVVCSCCNFRQSFENRSYGTWGQQEMKRFPYPFLFWKDPLHRK